jgi:hypothetical protein
MVFSMNYEYLYNKIGYFIKESRYLTFVLGICTIKSGIWSKKEGIIYLWGSIGVKQIWVFDQRNKVFYVDYGYLIIETGYFHDTIVYLLFIMGICFIKYRVFDMNSWYERNTIGYLLKDLGYLKWIMGLCLITYGIWSRT